MTFKNAFQVTKYLTEAALPELEEGQELCISKKTEYNPDAGFRVATYSVTVKTKPRTSYRRYPSKYRR